MPKRTILGIILLVESGHMVRRGSTDSYLFEIGSVGCCLLTALLVAAAIHVYVLLRCTVQLLSITPDNLTRAPILLLRPIPVQAARTILHLDTNFGSVFVAVA